MVINICICLVSFLVFSFLRIREFSQKYYAPKQFNPAVTLKPIPLPMTFFGWFLPIITYKEPKVIESLRFGRSPKGFRKLSEDS